MSEGAEASEERRRGALDGVAVVDLSQDLGGAYCARLLDATGATVTALEPPDGAPLRRWAWARRLPADETGPLFRYLRQGQRSVTDAGGRREALLAGADVVIAGPDGPVDPSGLARARPDLVVVSITPYGLTGPYAGRPATEFTAQADSGAIAVRGTADRPPVQMGNRVVEWVAGAYGAVAAVIAQGRQEATGHGDLIDVSLCEVANLTGTTFMDLIWSLLGLGPAPEGQAARMLELPSIEPTLDGYVGFNTNSREQFESFCIMIDRADLLGGDWADLATRMGRADEWNEIVHAWTSQRTTAEIVEQAAALRVPVAPVCDGEAVTQLDQVGARGLLVPDPAGPGLVPIQPWRIADDPVPAVLPAPGLGAHDAEPPPTGRARPTATGAPRPPLAGTFVVDLTAWWAGPSATGLLAAMGAEVVHVESVERPDGMRMSGGTFIGRDAWWEHSAFFLAANANKQDLTLDLDHAEGRALLLRLIEQADLVVENYTPRVVEAFGLDWDTVHATNPRSVMVRMPAFGLDGPWRDRPGFAQTMEQLVGLAWMTGHVDDQPRIQRGPCDPNGGLHAALAALLALRRRDRTGEGCLVVAPMIDAALAIAAEPALEWTTYGNRIHREGNRGPSAAPQGLYATDQPERWLALAVADDDQWAALAGVLGDEALAADPALSRAPGRRTAHDRIDAAIGTWAAQRSLDDAVAELLAAGVPAAHTTDPRGASAQPHLVARGYFEAVEHPVVGTHPTPGLPWRARGVDAWIRQPAPTLGQHNRAVLGGRLGLDDATIDRLEAEAVIGTRLAGH